MKDYNFATPIKINFIIDESLIEIDTIKDLENLQEEYDIDLSYVIDKCESNILNDELDDDFNEHDDYYAMPIEDVFQDIVSENWDDIIKKLNKEYKLKDLEISQINSIFELTKNHFNKNIIIDFPNIISVEIDSYNITKSEFNIKVITEKELNKEEIEDLRIWLDLQTTENWGYGFSKFDISDTLNVEDSSVFVKPWSLNKELRYIK